ncbi:HAD family hydrolase [Crossiella cryophila]
MLDFDGPVCSVFSGFPAPVVADQLRELLAAGGHTDLPASGDPFDVLRHAAVLGPEAAHRVEAALRAHEAKATGNAEPTPGAVDLISAWRQTGRPLAIVSNNSAAAIESYLGLHGLHRDIDAISARAQPDPALLKPNPHLVDAAAAMLGVPIGECVLVGDSVTDIEAAHAAGARTIGYANKPGKDARLAKAGADAISGAMSQIARCVGVGT